MAEIFCLHSLHLLEGCSEVSNIKSTNQHEKYLARKNKHGKNT